MNKDDDDACEISWLRHPKQANNGYIPYKDDYEAGWFAALDYERNKKLEQKEEG